MPSVDELIDEIMGTELTLQQRQKAKALFDEVPHVSTLLHYLEDYYLEEICDEQAFRIVHQCRLAIATHEAETD